MGRPVKAGSTNQSTTIRIIDACTGAPEQAVNACTAGIALWYQRGPTGAVTALTEVNLCGLCCAHSDGGLIHKDDGYYRVDPPDAAWAACACCVTIGGAVTGMIVIGNTHHLVAYDPTDTVRLGLTALPNAAADAAGGLVISDAGGQDIDTAISNIAAILVDTGTCGVVIVNCGISAAKTAADFIAEINAAVDCALNTAIPACPTANSINQRIVAIDDLTQPCGSGDLAAILTDTNSLNDTKVPDTISLAAINAEVVDVITVDTHSEPSQGIPPATPTLAQTGTYPYFALTNKVVVDVSGCPDQKQFSNRAESAILWEKNLTDACCVYTEDTGISGA